MASSIEGYLNDIRNARYGEDVRNAIYNSILACYTDVSNSETTATTAANSALNAASTAITARVNAVSATTLAISAASAALAAASSASAQADRAGQAADSLIGVDLLLANISSAASYAREQGSIAASAATVAISATTSAISAASLANSAATIAEQKGNTAAIQASAAESMALFAQSQANAAIAAASTITNLTVSGTQIGPNDPTPDNQLVILSTVNGHKHLQIKLRQGANGADFVIKGSAFSTISALVEETSILNPAIGDCYNVGESAPYEVYRWTGDTTVGESGWEDQGQIGNSINNLTTSEINTLWATGAISAAGNKYINQGGLGYLFTSIIKSEFSAQSSAIAAKVDSDGNKVLSDNNYTTTEKNQVSKIGTLTNLTTSSKTDLVAAINEINSGVSTVSTNVGSLSSLTTSSKSSIVDAANEINAAVGSVAADVGSLSSLTTTDKSSIVAAANELKTGLTNKITYYSLNSLNTNGSSGTILTIQAPSSTPNIINSNTVVLECVFGSPNTVISDVSWESYTGTNGGYVVFTGKTVASSPVYVALGTKGN